MKFLKWFFVYMVWVLIGGLLLHFSHAPIENLVIIYGSVIIANQETK